MASIRERRRSDGTRAYAVLWRDPDTGRQTSLTYDDRNDAVVALKLIEAAGGHAAEAARIADAVRQHGPSVDDVISEHIDLLTSVGADTRAHYRQQLASHISPELGAYPVAFISYRHVSTWVRSMSARGYSPKTIANVHGLFSAAMSTAVRLGYRPDNPCARVELPKSQATHDDMTVLTRDEFALLLSKIPAHYQPLVLLLVATGLRWGEATALTVGDVDLVSQPATVRVTKAWKRDENRAWFVGPPKTRRARRTVSLPDDLVDVLLPLVASKAPDELLFPNTVGRQLSSSRFWTTTWTPALEAAMNPRLPDGSPDPAAPRLTKRPRVHDLRHTHASWMIAAGVDLFVLQRRLGHESITTTTETYAHLLPDQQRAAADAASRALQGISLRPRDGAPAAAQ
ncbi:tyrosine-type recombinase/integrase [Cellulomonas alba]|uniref:Site-specific integrase n=1 Tax=Cellulomonas alba TaxID=3053467 RepID=A0ABT7SKE8_9CELL|nr:site-specific integrase [Cellulomonas alba]MDM7856653.1 site-specific integrase [Cellulomonas alba]